MSNLLHTFENTPTFESKMYKSEVDYYLRSTEGQKVIAKQYVGLPYDEID